MPGVRFYPIRFTPTTREFAGQECGGITIIIERWDRFVPVLTGLAVAETLHTLFPQAWDSSRYNRLLANKAAFEAFLAGATAESLVKSWQEPIRQFRDRCRPHLLYG